MSDPLPPLALTAVVITRDAGAELAACLASTAFAAESIVVDSGSRDDTVEIARRCGARVIEQSWLGFGPQKNFAVAQAAHDWILCLDADELVSPELAAAISEVLAAPRHTAYAMPRRNRFLGRWLRHGEGYPDWNVRLFHRGHARWSDDAVHEHVLAEGPVGRLAGDLLHASAESLDAYLAKQNRYTTLQAEALYARGERFSALRLVFSPLLRFFRFYVLRAGFLDGTAGLAHITIGCFNSFCKYAKLRALEQAERGR
ncbi:MAG TPA: glycosyltransferase family 2 protein [Casimicrobiaceae bacterium]|nr:glycosyltransferase family 2 protein [Casimicrobiaceae bacterium]